MRILIRGKQCQFPELSYGERGREFSCLLADELDWQQLNYGQGEGQFSWLACEWGIYYDEDGSLSLELHEGEMNFSDAVNLVAGIKEKIEKNYDVELEVLFIT